MLIKQAIVKIRPTFYLILILVLILITGCNRRYRPEDIKWQEVKIYDWVSIKLPTSLQKEINGKENYFYGRYKDNEIYCYYEFASATTDLADLTEQTKKHHNYSIRTDEIYSRSSSTLRIDFGNDKDRRSTKTQRIFNGNRGAEPFKHYVIVHFEDMIKQEERLTFYVYYNDDRYDDVVNEMLSSIRFVPAKLDSEK